MEGSFELDEYIKLSGKDPVIMSFVVCVNTSAGDKNSFNEEYDKLYEVLSKIQALGVNTRLCLRFVPPNVYSECIKYLETYADTDSVFDDIIRDYPVKLVDTRSFVNFEEGELKLTKENYINQRKEAN